MKPAHLILTALLLVPSLASAQNPLPDLSVAAQQHDAHMEWWHEAKFGMFVHWGLYAKHARGEWVMLRETIPVAEYAKLATEFNPVKFSADEWVRFAKDAGMKYIVITSKHHDGFAMYHSKVSPYNIVDATPFKRDPLKELADACAKEGIKLGFYYSQAQDWHHPGGGMNKTPWDDAQKGDFESYLRTLAIPQVKELLTQYNPAVIWFDTPVKMTPEAAREFIQVARTLRPETVMNSRLLYSGKSIEGLDPTQLDDLRRIGVDYLSYGDRQIPEHPAPTWQRDWETCMTLNNAWGYNEKDQNWKSPQTVVQMLGRVASKGSNFLLNFGPTAEGDIPAPSVAVMKQVGAWLRVNGEAIYGARPSDLIGLAKPSAPAAEKTEAAAAPAISAKRAREATPKIEWLTTARPASPEKNQPAKLYLHIYQWPSGQLEVKGIADKVSKAYLLGDAKRTPLKFSQQDGVFSVELSGKVPDPIAPVVCLECAAE